MGYVETLIDIYLAWPPKVFRMDIRKSLVESPMNIMAYTLHKIEIFIQVFLIWGANSILTLQF